MSNDKYAVAISGGVDSAIAAYLTKSKYPKTIAIFMKNWNDDTGVCNIEQELAIVKSIANKLEIELHVVNFSEEYRQEVFKEFLDDYAAGMTPNPDILCNKNIKFRHLLNKAKDLGANKIVTGHYAKIIKKNNMLYLEEAVDSNKDQSYFLSSLSQEQISFASFPLGEMLKSDVRKLAKSIGLPNHDKKDSTGICFIEPNNFQSFLQSYILAKPGLMLNDKGETIGQHHGLPFYTIGQRSGLNIGGMKGYSGDPWFVYGKNFADNTLLLVQGKNHPLLFSKEIKIGCINWTIEGDTEEFLDAPNLSVRIRHLGQKYKCSIVNNTVLLQERIRAVTPGQYAAFYIENICLGCAKILP